MLEACFRTRTDHIGCSRLCGRANHSSVGDQRVAPVSKLSTTVHNSFRTYTGRGGARSCSGSLVAFVTLL
jgi:hypothetical protein